MPWALYAWSRVAWHPDTPADEIVKRLFRRLLREAGRPMQAWYDLLESRMLQQDLEIGWGGRAHPALFTDDIVAKMKPLGEQAKKAAHTWYEKERVATALNDLQWSYATAHGKDGRAAYPCYRMTKPPVMDGTLE